MRQSTYFCIYKSVSYHLDYLEETRKVNAIVYNIVKIIQICNLKGKYVFLLREWAVRSCRLIVNSP